MQLDGIARERVRDHASPPARVGRDVGAEVDGGRACLVDERGQLTLWRSVPDDEPAATFGEARVELAQALEHELGPRPGGVTAVQQPVVEAEGRHEAIGAAAGCRERRVVVQP